MFFGDIEAALAQVFHPTTLLFNVLGTAIGIIFGCIPGLTVSMLIILALPFSYYLIPENAISLLVAMYVGGVSGGLVSAVLFNMPGTPSSVMTTLDGAPMAKKSPEQALGLAILASLCGGVVGFIFLFFLTEPLAKFALLFGPFEVFSLVLMALVLMVSVSQGSILLGLISGFWGLLAAVPGYDPLSGRARFVFGTQSLEGGFSQIPVLIGMFVLSGMFMSIREYFSQGEIRQQARVRTGISIPFHLLGLWNTIRSSLIGVWVGVLPGVGGNIGSVISYSMAKNFSKTPELFGKGAPEGVVASEAANNAAVGGALIPLLSLGIPGSLVAAVMLGAFTIHGLTPGPLLFSEGSTTFVYSIILGYLLSNFLMFGLMIILLRPLIKMVTIPYHYLFPAILIFCVLGTYALNNRIFDVVTMVIFAAVGVVFIAARMPLAPFIIGLILEPTAEMSLRTGLSVTQGSVVPLFTRPLSLAFLLISLVSLVLPLYKDWRKKVKNRLREKQGV